MKYLALAALILFSFALAAQAKPKPSERWLYGVTRLGNDQELQQSIAQLEVAKAAGVTHINVGDGRWFRQSENQDYLRRVAAYKAAAAKANINVVVGVYAIGYSGRYLPQNKNLAAGLPVRDMLFIVKGDTATVDMSQSITIPKGNADGWAEGIKGKAFTHYRFNLVTKEKPANDISDDIRVSSAKAKRWLTRSNPRVKQQGDAWLVTTTFNSLDDDNLRVLSKFKDATVTLEPVGLARVIRRDMCPLKITSEDGKTVYEEGKDFEKIVDPNIEKKFTEYDMDEPGPDIHLTKNSRIKDGQKLKVSFFHFLKLGNDQDIISTQDPAVFELMEKDVSLAVKVWGQDVGIMMGYDEIRIGGWEIEPDGKQRTGGEILAWHTKKGYDLIKRYAPKAKIYAWSSMYSPEHNAFPFSAGRGYYYLVNGNWDGSWEGLPKDVIIINWHAKTSAYVKWFADRGHQQIIGAYYDQPAADRMKNNIETWHDRIAGIKGIIGWQYTSFHNHTTQFPEFFKLIDTFDQWGKSGTGQTEKEPGVER